MLIGTVGFIGAGKDTVGDILINEHGYFSDAFATSVKDAASVIFGWDRAMLEGDTAEHRYQRDQRDKFWSEKLGIEGFTPRMGLQMLGTESGRDVFGDALWISGVEKRWDSLGRPNMVITDCRYPNEIEMVKTLGGTIWLVTRGNDPEWYQDMYFHNAGESDDEDKRLIRQMRATGDIPHESETAWIGTDYDEIIRNDGSIEELVERVSVLTKRIDTNN
jgi:hypothetical protein